MQRPELLAPAGNLDKLYSASHFGADAIYVGLKKFSMRSFAGNFSLEELAIGTNYLHQKNKKIYVTINVLPFDDEYQELKNILGQLGDIGIDAVIISDPGLMDLVPKNIETHLSTQCSVTNAAAANFWFSQGISQIVLARELSLERLIALAPKAQGRLEIFIHGAVCIAWSGRCLLSLYSVGRDPRRGECAQPCRWPYRLAIEEEKNPTKIRFLEEDGRGSYFFDADDLCLLPLLPELLELNIASYKIEGRTRSTYYVGIITDVYNYAINLLLAGEKARFTAELPRLLKELHTASKRELSSHFVGHEENLLSSYHVDGSRVGGDQLTAGRIVGFRGKYMEVRITNTFVVGDELELCQPNLKRSHFIVKEIKNDEGFDINRAQGGHLVLLPKIEGTELFDLIRKPLD